MSDKATSNQMEDVDLLSAMNLLNREADPSYIEKWTSILAQPAPEPDVEGQAVVVFRLGDQWLAITAAAFSLVMESRKVHSIPHKNNRELLGVVNFQGRFSLCIDMKAFIGVGDRDCSTVESSYSRMLAIQDQNEQWIFPADEIYGVYRLDPSKLEDFSLSGFKSSKNYFRGFFKWDEKNVSLFDEELLFYSLRRSLS